ncbi:hypothetical protein BC833DRAFT_566751 [Globomyces pollinis-pini]|nr:hypothetical protein BC833DRAFT_566751 [Globomyces pollinis-pini]
MVLFANIIATVCHFQTTEPSSNIQKDRLFLVNNLNDVDHPTSLGVAYCVKSQEYNITQFDIMIEQKTLIGVCRLNKLVNLDDIHVWTVTESESIKIPCHSSPRVKRDSLSSLFEVEFKVDLNELENEVELCLSNINIQLEYFTFQYRKPRRKSKVTSPTLPMIPIPIIPVVGLLDCGSTGLYDLEYQYDRYWNTNSGNFLPTSASALLCME